MMKNVINYFESKKERDREIEREKRDREGETARKKYENQLLLLSIY